MCASAASRERPSLVGVHREVSDELLNNWGAKDSDRKVHAGCAQLKATADSQREEMAGLHFLTASPVGQFCVH